MRTRAAASQVVVVRRSGAVCVCRAWTYGRASKKGRERTGEDERRRASERERERESKRAVAGARGFQTRAAATAAAAAAAAAAQAQRQQAEMRCASWLRHRGQVPGPTLGEALALGPPNSSGQLPLGGWAGGSAL
jgi:hypothetical protein